LAVFQNKLVLIIVEACGGLNRVLWLVSVWVLSLSEDSSGWIAPTCVFSAWWDSLNFTGFAVERY
jgi:hypothetical protein